MTPFDSAIFAFPISHPMWQATAEIGTMRATYPPVCGGFFIFEVFMQDVLVLGAGKVGALISGLLAESGDYRVQLVDSKPGVAAQVANAHGLDNIEAFELDASNKDILTKHVRAHKPSAVISALPFYCNVDVAQVARYGIVRQFISLFVAGFFAPQ